MSHRPLLQILASRPAADGDGVHIRRTLGDARHDMDPFLMLDEIRSDDRGDFAGGFPPHPHRGMETLTYMLDGGFRHEDHMGNSEAIGAGGAQWMRAGRGVIHSEMPLPGEERIHGFQLWINLPADRKLSPPAYQDTDAAHVPVMTPVQGSRVRVLAGAFDTDEGSATGPLDQVSAGARVADVRLDAGATLEPSLPEDHRVLAYVIDGTLSVGPPDAETVVHRGDMAVMGDGERLRLHAGDDGTHLLLLSGRPLGEPIVQHGPFVMNTDTEIRQAITDFRNGTLAQ